MSNRQPLPEKDRKATDKILRELAAATTATEVRSRHAGHWPQPTPRACALPHEVPHP
jgi:hypothetical protein